MSEADTLEALEAAIRQHVSTAGEGAYLTDWVLIAAAAVSEDPDATMYFSETSGGPMHHKLGLVRYIAKRFDGMVDEDCDE